MEASLTGQIWHIRPSLTPIGISVSMLRYFTRSAWRTRPSDALLIDPYSKIQVGYVYNGSTMIKAGLDTRSGPIEDWNGGKTGYYLRKWVDPTLDPRVLLKQTVPFKHLRYGEMLLNYAEACIDSRYGEAITYINMIRKKRPAGFTCIDR